MKPLKLDYPEIPQGNLAKDLMNWLLYGNDKHFHDK